MADFSGIALELRQDGPVVWPTRPGQSGKNPAFAQASG